MVEVIETLDEHFRLVLILGILGFFVITAVVRAVTSMYTTHCRERSRREIAAYIAEGTISPEQGERLMKANVSGDRPGSLC